MLKEQCDLGTFAKALTSGTGQMSLPALHVKERMLACKQSVCQFRVDFVAMGNRKSIVRINYKKALVSLSVSGR